MALAEQKRQLIERWRREGIDPTLLRAFQAVPREEFLPSELRDRAYDDQPLPIGHEQTISQPTTILIMLSLLDLVPPRSKGNPPGSAGRVSPKVKVLEIGAGSGYVCALLAELGLQVTGIELIPELAVRAAKTLTKLGYDKAVSMHAADGSGGWEEGAPYDRILLSAGAPDVPQHLFWQLKEGGVLVAPVGRVEQRMLVCRKKKGEIIEEDHGAFLFVPLKGKYGVEGEGDIPTLPFV
jgi:protein-L-isoaspartate(D-aspartate) O-methyltransferase